MVVCVEAVASSSTTWSPGASAAQTPAARARCRGGTGVPSGDERDRVKLLAQELAIHDEGLGVVLVDALRDPGQLLTEKIQLLEQQQLAGAALVHRVHRRKGGRQLKVVPDGFRQIAGHCVHQRDRRAHRDLAREQLGRETGHQSGRIRVKSCHPSAMALGGVIANRLSKSSRK